MNILDRMPDEMTGDKPVARVFPIKHSCDVAGIWAAILRKFAKQTTVNDDGQSVVAVINTEKGRIFIKGHILDENKLDEFLALDNTKDLV